MSKFVDIKELSEVIHLSIPMINKLIRQREIPTYKIGKRRLFDKDEVIEWIKERYKENK